MPVGDAEICKFTNRLCDSRAEYSETGSLICSDASCRCCAIKREKGDLRMQSANGLALGRFAHGLLGLRRMCLTESHYRADR